MSSQIGFPTATGIHDCLLGMQLRFLHACVGAKTPVSRVQPQCRNTESGQRLNLAIDFDYYGPLATF